MTSNVVAIDGPAGAGKSTVAHLVAKALGLDVLDTGAMYRCVTWAVLDAGVDLADEAEVVTVATRVHVEQRGESWFCGDTDVTATIREPAVTAAVSVVAANPAVRERLVALQRAWLVAHGGGVVEGRDIGSVVVPDARLKVYLDADPRVRAGRRALEQSSQGGDAPVRSADLEAHVAAMEERDRLDSTRTMSPLVRAADAVVLDTTGLSIDGVVEAIVALWREPTRAAGPEAAGSTWREAPGCETMRS